jgi:hypothetical protein
MSPARARRHLGGRQRLGAVNIGDALSSGRLELTLLQADRPPPPAPTSAPKVISIAGDSVFHIAPFLHTGVPFFDGWRNFDNEGLILIAPGGELVESSPATWIGPIRRPSSTTRIGVQGVQQKHALGAAETNLAGNGSIVLDGGTSTIRFGRSCASPATSAVECLICATPRW